MRVMVKESFMTAKGNIPCGVIIDIPESMLECIRGKVEPLVFNSSHWQNEIEKLLKEMTAKDPGGDCWQWLKDNRSELWKEHLAADMAIDQAYREQNTEKIGAAISKARATYTAMLEAWCNRHNYNQPSIMAA